MITLYDYFRSTACYRVRIALNIKQINYTKKPVHLVNNGGEQHSAEYVQLNPQQLVPTLIDGNATITQSLAILEYLQLKYPEPSILPNDIIAKTKVRSIAQAIACDIHPLNNLRVLNYIENDRDVWYQHWIKLGFSALESLLNQYQTNPKFCIGDTVSIADICLIPQVFNANRFNCDLADYPRIIAINDACLQLPEFIAAKPFQ